MRTLALDDDRSVIWDLRDDAGRPAASGIYLVRTQMIRSTPATQRVVVLR